MARITVEDCINQVPNRFELIMLAAHRARQLSEGADPTVPRDHDKNPVVALREIAENTILPESLAESLAAEIANPRSTTHAPEDLIDPEVLSAVVTEDDDDETEDDE